MSYFLYKYTHVYTSYAQAMFCYTIASIWKNQFHKCENCLKFPGNASFFISTSRAQASAAQQSSDVAIILCKKTTTTSSLYSAMPQQPNTNSSQLSTDGATRNQHTPDGATSSQHALGWRQNLLQMICRRVFVLGLTLAPHAEWLKTDHWDSSASETERHNGKVTHWPETKSRCTQ